jgi:hypothetical protein
LPADNLQQTSQGQQVLIPNPQIGNLRNRIDVLNMTTGVSAVIADRLLLTTAVAFPLLPNDNRTFDWELQFQLNWQFGGTRFRAPPVAGP